MSIKYLNNNNELIEADNINQVPDSIEALISYKPVIPKPPHTDEQHREIENHKIIFRELMKKCRV